MRFEIGQSLLELTRPLAIGLIVFSISLGHFSFGPSAATFCQEPSAEKTVSSSPKSEDSSPNLFPLGYRDLARIEFCKISQEQTTELLALESKWDKEYKRLVAKNESEQKEKGWKERRAVRKLIGDAFDNAKQKCNGLLSEDQLKRQDRFNLLTSSGLESIRLMDRVILMGDPKLDDDQTKQFYAVKTKWIKQADKTILPSEEIDKETLWNEGLPGMVEFKRDHAAAYRKQLLRILNIEQVERFLQIEWQSFITLHAVKVFQQPSAQQELELSKKQIANLDEILKQIENAPNRFDAMRLKLDGYQEYFESLSDSQKATWRNMLGEPFKVNQIDWLIKVMEADKSNTPQASDR